MKHIALTERIEQAEAKLAAMKARAATVRRKADTQGKILFGAAVLKIGDNALLQQCMSVMNPNDRSKVAQWLTAIRKEQEVTHGN